MRRFLRLLVILVVGYTSGCAARTRSPLWESPRPAAGVPAALRAPSETAERAGDDAPAGALVATVLRAVAAHNPLVEAARRRWLAATYKRPQVVVLPEPKLEYRYFVQQMSRAEEQWELTLSQDIPPPGKLRVAGQIADTEAEIAYLRYQTTLRNALAEAKEVYSELAYIDQAQHITAEIETLYARYAALAVGGLEVAAPKLPEHFRATSQRAQLGYDLVVLQEIRLAEMARLRAVTGRAQDWQIPQVPALPTPPAFTPPLEALQAQAAQYNQELATAGLMVVQAQYHTQLAARAPLPDVTLRAGYTRTGTARLGPDPTRDPITLGIGVSLPVWTGKYTAMQHAAKEAEHAAVAEHAAQQLQVRADLARAYFSLQNSARLVRLYRDTLIPQARQALLSAETFYRQGTANLAALLETTATIHNFTLAQARATADFYQHVARIERVIGTALELTPAAQEEQSTP